MITPNTTEDMSDKKKDYTTTPESWPNAKTPTTGSSGHVEPGMTTKIVVVDGVDGLTPDMLRTTTSYEPVKKERPPRTATLYGGPMDGDTVEVQGTHLRTHYIDPRGTHRQWRGLYKWRFADDGTLLGIWESDY